MKQYYETNSSKLDITNYRCRFIECVKILCVCNTNTSGSLLNKHIDNFICLCSTQQLCLINNMSLTIIITVVKSEANKRIIWCCMCRIPVLILPVEVGLCQFQCWFWFTASALVFLHTRIVDSMNVTFSVWLNEINVFI